jgi:hypothetical protein
MVVHVAIDQNRDMNDELLAVLKEIAAELKDRNEQNRVSSARHEGLMKDLEEKRKQFGLGADGEKSIHQMRLDNIQRMEKTQADAEKRQAERVEFEKELIAELRRMNTNLEALVRKGTSAL